ncbi:MAG TPA: serine hydrolase [Allocoleopsis sp.]
MAASMDNRRQPENPEFKQQEQQDLLRPNPRRVRQPQSAGAEVVRPVSPLPEYTRRRVRLRFPNHHLTEQLPQTDRPKNRVIRDRITPPSGPDPRQSSGANLNPPAPPDEIARSRPRLRSMRIAQMSAAPMPTRTRPMPIRQLISQKIGLPSDNVPSPHLRQRRLNLERSNQQPTLRAVPGVAIPQDSQTSRGRKRRPTTQVPLPELIKPQGDTASSRQQPRPRLATPAAVTPPSGNTKRARRDRAERSTRGNNSKGTTRSDYAFAQRLEEKRSAKSDRSSAGSGVQSAPSQKNRKPQRQQKRLKSPLVYLIRLLILGIGIGSIVGTLLSVLNPATQASVKVEETAKTEVQESPNQRSMATLRLGQEMVPLKSQIQTLATQNPNLQPGVFVLDLNTGAYLDWNSQTSFASASTIKLPVLVAFFQDVEAGKIRLDETLTLKPEMIATGSGDLQYKPPGTQLSALAAVSKMIQISDNTATNMLVARLGGKEVLNQRFRSWGLSTTTLNNPLPDIEGTNVTSPKELATLLAMIDRGQLVSKQSHDLMLDIMRKTEINNLLPQGLGEGATIAHKTGNIGSILADAGLVEMPTGKRYIIAVIVKRPFNDTSAQELIRQISHTAYDYLNQPQASPSTTSLPSENPVPVNRAIASEGLPNQRPSGNPFQ